MIQYKGISTLEVLVEAKNYNRWISETIKVYIHSPAIEIGAGIGNVTRYFLETKSLHVTDKDKGLVKHLKRQFVKEKNVKVATLDVTKKIAKNFLTFFSTVYAINVLEHIEDDQTALRNIHSLLKKNGKLIILVPAKQFAYTRLDRELGHFRRYEKNELTQKLIDAGYKIDSIRFFNIVGLLSWYIRDKVKSNNIHLKPYHIAIFDSFVPFLRFVESKITIPIGISLIVVARKKS